MSEFSLASTTAKNKTHLSSLLLSDFMLFCSFVLSHPLYFSYFIFFSPYLFKIFSFLSPLFATTTLLLLAFFTLTPSFVSTAGSCHLELPESKLEAYKIVFETSTTLEITETPVEVLEMQEAKEDCLQAVELEASTDKGVDVPETFMSGTLDEKSAEITRPGTNQVKAVVKIFEDFLQEKEGVGALSSKKREKEVKSLSVESNKGEEQKEEEFMRSGSKAMRNKISDPKMSVDNGGEQHAAKAMVNSQRVIRANWSTENDGDKGEEQKEEEFMGSGIQGNGE
ncbi:uncharacterized protein LOC111313482 [Durio zibethinus]|uniref:Uncharacterized protein LOC111313482 n=1 Tax=Durio zibethinus TaxID=66656 RepID=A0A6P6AYF2_DURZI|nr:uncharacterized protein LOC111313482 [Durio zibethinus]